MILRKRFQVILSLAALTGAAQALGCGFDLTWPDRGEGGSAGTDGMFECVAELVPGCTVDPECLAIASNAGKLQPSFRVASLYVSAPAAFERGLVELLTSEIYLPSVPGCLALGSGAMSWLIQLDLGMGTLRTGTAEPGYEDPQGYRFFERVYPIAGSPRLVGPATFDLVQDPDGTLRTATTGDLYLRVFTSLAPDPNGEPLVFPMHDFSMHGIDVSSAGNCIGRFTPERYLPLCDESQIFSPAGSIDAYISLEEADAVTFSDLKQSLCVFLSGDVSTFGDHAMPISHCKRTQGVIDFAGDWCAGSGPATATCHDAVRVHADFAASAVDIAP